MCFSLMAKHRPFRVNMLTVMCPFQGRWMVGLLSIQIGVNPYPMLFDPFGVFTSSFPLFPLSKLIHFFIDFVGEGFRFGRVGVDVEDFREAFQGSGTSDGVFLTVPIGEGLALAVEEMRTEDFPFTCRLAVEGDVSFIYEQFEQVAQVCLRANPFHPE